MQQLLIRVTRPWTRSLGLQLETLLALSALWPLLIFGLIYQLTASHTLAFLGMVIMGVAVLLVGHRIITRLITPLAMLNRQLRTTAAGDLRERLPTETVERQYEGLAAFTAARMDAILIAPVDSRELVGPVQAARAAGIPVIAVDATLDDATAVLALVQSDNYGGGQQAAAEMIRLLDGRGRVAIISLSRHQKHTLAREEGFISGLAAAPGVQVLAVQHALADAHLAQEITLDLLRQYPDLEAFYTTNEPAGIGVIMALRKQGPAAPRRRVICWDLATLEIEALAAGLVDALIVQDSWAMGQQAVELALAAIAGQPLPPVVQLPTRLMTRANVAELAHLPGAATVPSELQPDRRIRIGFAIKSPQSDFWTELLAGARTRADATGVLLVLHDSLEGDINEIGHLRESFNLMIDNIRVLVQQLQQEAEIIGPRAQALVVAAASQAAIAHEQTATLDRLYQGIERLSQAAREIAGSTQAVADSASGTLRGVEQAELAVTDSSLRLREIIRRLSEALDLLGRRTTQVTAVADVMREIADQTHLLALNAAIESADAGAYGRRFGVIADEVRGLAGQALEATAGFQSIAADMRAAAEQGLAATQASARGTDLSMELVTQATSAIETIAGLAEHTSSAVQRISAAAAEQQQTNGDLAGFAARVTATSRQAAQASAALSTVAQDLTQVVLRLQETVAYFRIGPEASLAPPQSLPGTELRLPPGAHLAAPVEAPRVAG